MQINFTRCLLAELMNEINVAMDVVTVNVLNSLRNAKMCFCNTSPFNGRCHMTAILIWPRQTLIQLTLSFRGSVPTIKFVCLYIAYANKEDSRIVLFYPEDRGSKPYETSISFNQFSLCHISQVPNDAVNDKFKYT
jgi:hypothetical protein